ncbi:SDR family NAD(P)-dependent oxidoreductase, partial [Gammaproteobacteria bacterium]|nr:SDR family NAD(P)-dependent oxidoreductase [Gammaproteobacteria bacterium]
MKRRIIITGGAKGLGLEISKIALNRGYEVGIIDNDKTAVKLAKEQNEGIRGCVANVTKEEEVKEALDRLGTPNVLVNNAGIVRFGPLIEQSVEDF